MNTSQTSQPSQGNESYIRVYISTLGSPRFVPIRVRKYEGTNYLLPFGEKLIRTYTGELRHLISWRKDGRVNE